MCDIIELRKYDLPDLIHHIASEARNTNTVEAALVDLCSAYVSHHLRIESFRILVYHHLVTELNITYSEIEKRRTVASQYWNLLKRKVCEYCESHHEKRGGAN